MKKVVHIVGPTGVGKTNLAFKLAKAFDGQLVSADSIQVYKGLDVVSGKDIPKDSLFSILPQFSDKNFTVGFYSVHDIPIYLLDVITPSFSFSVSHFNDLGKKIISFVLEKDKLPIVVGGTGFYTKSLIDDIKTISIKPNFELRSSLEELGVKDLLNMLSIEKIGSMNDSDKNNKRRLMRAIEVEKSGVLNSINNNPNNYNHLQIGLMAPRDFLKDKIEKRVSLRFANGTLEETTGLFENYEELSQQVKDANGYKQLFSYLKNEVSLEEAIEKWKISEYRHAKNQMTWFLKDKRIKWFDITKKEFESEIDNEVAEFTRNLL